MISDSPPGLAERKQLFHRILTGAEPLDERDDGADGDGQQVRLHPSAIVVDEAD